MFTIYILSSTSKRQNNSKVVSQHHSIVFNCCDVGLSKCLQTAFSHTSSWLHLWIRPSLRTLDLSIMIDGIKTYTVASTLPPLVVVQSHEGNSHSTLFKIYFNPKHDASLPSNPIERPRYLTELHIPNSFQWQTRTLCQVERQSVLGLLCCNVH